MPLVSVSVDAFLLAAATVLVSTVFVLRRQPALLTLRTALTLLVVLNSLYVLYTLLVRWPPNIFQRLKIPLTTPSDTIRAVLLQRAGLPPDAVLPKPLDALLTRLGSFDMRTLYVRSVILRRPFGASAHTDTGPARVPRFGQMVLQDCEYCTTFDEYLIFAAPRIAHGYVAAAAVAGLVTVRGSGHERWRTYAVALLAAAFFLEGYWIATTPIGIPRDGLNVFMWHDNLWLARHLLFLLLPVLIHALPLSPPRPNPGPLLSAARGTLEHTHAQLLGARFAHAAAARQPALRAAAGEWWERQRAEGAWAREDPHVQRAAERLGRGFREGAEGDAGKLSRRAKDALRQMLESIGLGAPPQLLPR
ncbi:hypothetical protein BD413DRAFT_609721 [Trametes elegans]|nr:hypothetical protein BD413DRAFT_609721 [Trametes elegans]